MKENILSWSLANFVSVALMLAILWVCFGVIGHVAIRGPAMKKASVAVPAEETAQTVG